MSQFAELMTKYKAEMDKMGIPYQSGLLESVAKGLGPSIYNADAALVACSDKTEMDRVKKNFLMGKLGLSESDDMDKAIETVCSQYKTTARKRVIVYYMLAKHYGKLQEVYG